MSELRKKLKHQLKIRKSKQYLEWVAFTKDRGKDGHHIVGKRNDFLIAKIDHSQHMTDPYSDFDDQLIEALENLFDYIEDLERNNPI